jgi:hypothetical protein
MAAKGKLTPATTAKVVQALRLGATVELACEYAGIHRDTHYDWLARAAADDTGESPHAAYARAIEEAGSTAAVEALARIQKAAKEGTWQAAAWLLERRYGYRSQADHRIEVAPMSPETAADRIALVLERARARIAGEAPAQIITVEPEE